MERNLHFGSSYVKKHQHFEVLFDIWGDLSAIFSFLFCFSGEPKNVAQPEANLLNASASNKENNTKYLYQKPKRKDGAMKDDRNILSAINKF